MLVVFHQQARQQASAVIDTNRWGFAQSYVRVEPRFNTV